MDGLVKQAGENESLVANLYTSGVACWTPSNITDAKLKATFEGKHVYELVKLRSSSNTYVSVHKKPFSDQKDADISDDICTPN